MVLASLLFAPSSFSQTVASFDCAKASSVVEKFICKDRGLAELDQTLGEVFSNKREKLNAIEANALLIEQKNWLSYRDNACQIKSVDVTLSPEDIWTNGACLANIYDKRLLQLGVPGGGAFDNDTEKNPDFIHPLCLQLVTSSAWHYDPPELASVPLKACNEGFAHLSFDENHGKFGARDRDGFGGIFAYEPKGRLPDGRELAIATETSGGSGAVNQLIAITRENGADGVIKISTERLASGGDRCPGGFIENAEVIENDVFVDKAVTPKLFFEMIFNKMESDASDCYQCCIGTIRINLSTPDDTPNGRIISARIENSAGRSWQPDSVADKCLDEAVNKSGSGLPINLDSKELTVFRFRLTECLEK